MSQQTVYIRESDMEKWKTLEKKSEFIHEALKQIGEKKIIKTKADAEEAVTYKKTGNWGA